MDTPSRTSPPALALMRPHRTGLTEGGWWAMGSNGVGRGTVHLMEEDNRVQSRAEEAPPEESGAGTDDATAQAATILQDSDERQNDRNAAPSTVLEHRTSEDVTPPPG